MSWKKGRARLPFAPARGTLLAIDFGLVADGKVVTDVVTTGGSAQVSSATAGFTQSDVGKSVLINSWSSPLTGTLAYSMGGATITGTGTAFDSEITQRLGSLPEKSQIGLSNGKVITCNQVTSDTALLTRNVFAAAASGLTGYREVQAAGTIVSVESSTQCTLSFSAAISQSAREMFFFTDDTTALYNAVQAAIGLGAKELVLPAGIIGVTANGIWSGANGLTIRGAGDDETTIKDGRVSWEWYDYLTPGVSGAIMQFESPRYLTLRDLGVDGSVPYWGMERIRGTSLNLSGGRWGLVMRNPVRCTYYRVRSAGKGTGDETLYAEATVPNCSVRWIECTGSSNDNAINPNSGYIASEVRGCDVSSFYSAMIGAGDMLVTDCRFRAVVDTENNAERYADLVMLDAGSNWLCSGVEIFGGQSSKQAVALFSTFSGTGISGKTMSLRNVAFKGSLNGGFHFAGAGVMKLYNNGGPMEVSNVLFENIGNSATGGRYVYVSGNVTDVRFSNMTFLGDANMTVGIEVVAGVSNGAVRVDHDTMKFGPNITSPLILAANLAATKVVAGVSATGNVAVGTQTERVTGAGGITRTLYDPALTPGKRVTLVNASAGAVTMATAAAAIVGSTSVPTNTCAIFESDGTDWARV